MNFRKKREAKQSKIYNIKCLFNKKYINMQETLIREICRNVRSHVLLYVHTCLNIHMHLHKIKNIIKYNK